MINDVTDAFGDWLEPIEVTHAKTGDYDDNGRWKEGADLKETIQAVVQNATADDLVVLPEGMRTSETIKLHTTSDLTPLSEKDQTTGDVFPYQGREWRVVNVARRFIGNYNKALAIRNPNES